MVGLFIGFYLSCLLIIVGKAIADITADITAWESSIFSKFTSKDSFFGSKDFSYIRKDNPNKIINWLLHNPLVFVTDIWHLANTITRIGIYSSIVFAIFLGNLITPNVLNVASIVGSYILMNIFGFHLMFHWVMRK